MLDCVLSQYCLCGGVPAANIPLCRRMQIPIRTFSTKVFLAYLWHLRTSNFSLPNKPVRHTFLSMGCAEMSVWMRFQSKSNVTGQYVIRFNSACRESVPPGVIHVLSGYSEIESGNSAFTIAAEFACGNIFGFAKLWAGLKLHWKLFRNAWKRNLPHCVVPEYWL